MPKELTHWWLANEALKQLPLDLPIRKILEKEQAAYLLGAVLPDTLLHLVRGRWSKTALQLAHNFHAPSGNSFEPLAQFAETSPLTPAMVACLLGIASHMESDIVFHPYICALAHDDLGCHYTLETELDLWLLYAGKRPPVWRLETVMTEETTDLVLTVAQGVFDGKKELPREAFVQALQLHNKIQGMYGAPHWQVLTWLLGLLPIPGLQRWKKLFYPLHWQQGYNKIWPVQGDKTPDIMLADTLARISSLLRRVDEQGIIQSFKNHPGENLLTGLTFTPEPPGHTPTTTCATAPP